MVYDIGLDEVGRGAWAGPLVFAAVSFQTNPGFLSGTAGSKVVDGLADSKLLSRLKRKRLSDLIKSDHAVGIGFVSAKEVDALGLTIASRIACERALDELGISGKILLDGNYNYLQGTKYADSVSIQIDADATEACVMAASIIAKVARDEYMFALAAAYPQFGFDAHVGYGTKQHSEALKQFGVTPEHRQSYKPVAKLL